MMHSQQVIQLNTDQSSVKTSIEIQKKLKELQTQGLIV